MLSAHNFAFLNENFSTRKFFDNFLTAQNLGGERDNYPRRVSPATTPLADILCAAVRLKLNHSQNLIN